MVKLTYFIYLALLLSAAGCASSQGIDQRSPSQITIEDVQVDRLGKLYILYSDNSLVVGKSRQQASYEYANNRQGSIDIVDVSNPLKILVFFKDFATIKVLDNTLSEISNISFTQSGYEDIRAIGSSNDNNIWVYDAARYQLIKINDVGQEIATSINLTELQLNDINPTDITEGNNKVYVVDPNIGILVFDSFGQYMQLLPILNVQEVFIDRDRLLYQKGSDLYTYSKLNFEEEKITWPQTINEEIVSFGPFDKILVTPRTVVLMNKTKVGEIKR